MRELRKGPQGDGDIDALWSSTETLTISDPSDDARRRPTVQHAAISLVSIVSSGRKLALTIWFGCVAQESCRGVCCHAHHFWIRSPSTWCYVAADARDGNGGWTRLPVSCPERLCATAARRRRASSLYRRLCRRHLHDSYATASTRNFPPIPHDGPGLGACACSRHVASIISAGNFGAYQRSFDLFSGLMCSTRRSTLHKCRRIVLRDCKVARRSRWSSPGPKHTRPSRSSHMLCKLTKDLSHSPDKLMQLFPVSRSGLTLLSCGALLTDSTQLLKTRSEDLTRWMLDVMATMTLAKGLTAASTCYRGIR